MVVFIIIGVMSIKLTVGMVYRDVKTDRCVIVEEVLNHEDDFSAEDQTESESSWLPGQNEYAGWKKSSGFQKSKGQSKVNSIRDQKTCHVHVFVDTETFKGHNLLWPFCL